MNSCWLQGLYEIITALCVSFGLCPSSCIIIVTSQLLLSGNLELGPAGTGLHSEFTWPIVQEDLITSWSLGINLTY